jgi:3-deoxy-D-manno-octulosonate 8-phosphate phosphatase (KDO 8-P phosphatase)
MVKEYSNDVIERAKKITVLVMDVDGVLTDGRFVYSRYGDETKNFDVNDGLGIMLVKRAGLRRVILTAKASRVVTKRARELKIDKVYHNFHYKINALDKIKNAFGCKEEEICFIGDDVIDIPVLRRIGLAVCPPNAMDDVKTFAHLITEKKGGRGAVREVCDLLLRAQGKWDEIMSPYYA